MVSRPVLQFAVSGLLALLLVGIGAFFVLRSQGDAESVRDARRLTRILGTTAIEPALTDGLVRGDPAAIARLDRLVRDRVIVDPVVRVKLWTPDGRIVYSDEHRLIGARYALSDEDRASFKSSEVDAEIRSRSRSSSRSTSRSARPAGSPFCSSPTSATARSRPRDGASGSRSCSP
jgi:two-component system NarL family sensor kinase